MSVYRKRFVSSRAYESERLRAIRTREVPTGTWLHYFAWIPLAGVNGTFELDPLRIKKEVYTLLQPDMTEDDVSQLIEEFERVNLLRRFENEKDHKWYLWFVGSNKHSLLPSDKEKLKSPGDSPPPPAEWLIDGYEKPAPQEPEDEDTMKFKDRIAKISRDILHVAIHPSDRCWSEMASLKNQTSQEDVVESFRMFADENAHLEVRYPLSEFLRKEIDFADRVEEGKAGSTRDDKSIKEFCADLYAIGEVAFTGKYLTGLLKLLQEYTRAEVLEAYKEFSAERTDFQTPRTPADFVEGGADAVILTIRKRKVLLAEQEKLIERTRQKAIEDAAKRPKVEEEPFDLNIPGVE